MSTTRCSVAHCRNKTGKLAQNVVCFTIPTDTAQLDQWTAATKYPWKSGAKVCSDHFAATDLINTKNGFRLVKGSIPTIILPTSSSSVTINTAAATPPSENDANIKAAAYKRRATIGGSANIVEKRFKGTGTGTPIIIYNIPLQQLQLS